MFHLPRLLVSIICIYTSVVSSAATPPQSSVVSSKTNELRSESVPEPGQLNRYRAAPRNSLLSLVPVDGAEFIPGQYFDISIELHAIGQKDAFPSLKELKATINGTPLEQFFNKSYSPVDTWNFDHFVDLEARVNKNVTPIAVSRLALRSVKIPKAGQYTVELYVGKEKVFAEWSVRQTKPAILKNLILFIGDGMAPSMISAARYLSRKTVFGKFKGNFLHFEKLGTIGKIATNGLESMLTDSANSAAAYLTGHKGWANTLGVYADTSAPTLDDPKVETMAEYIRRTRPGMCIGIVTTAAVQDATPAAVYAHTRRRTDLSYITDQHINQFNFSGIHWDPQPVRADVLFGGGGLNFCNTSPPNNQTKSLCNSLDGRNYYDLFAKVGYKVVKSRDEMEAYGGSDPIVGIFARENMDTWIDRTVYPENLKIAKSHPDGNGESTPNQPGLESMVMKAISVMESRCKDKGFFMLAEAALVDKAMHALDYDRALGDLLELDRTVKAVQDWTKKTGNTDSTGIIVTADHAQGFDVFGSVDTTYFNSLPEDDTAVFSRTGKKPSENLQIQKRFSIAEYGEAGWPDLVVDENGLPTKWETRFRLASGKVDSIPHSEDFQLHKVPSDAGSPLTRNPTILDPSLESVFNVSIAIANPQEHGLHYNGNLPVFETHSVHTLTAVDIYCGGPDAFKIQCAQVMDNTELFFIMANALGLGFNGPSSDSFTSDQTRGGFTQAAQGTDISSKKANLSSREAKEVETPKHILKNNAIRTCFNMNLLMFVSSFLFTTLSLLFAC